MNGGRWRRLWDLFEEAVELPPEEQEAFLERACGSDVELCARLEALLEADRHTRCALDQPLVPTELWQEMRQPGLGGGVELESGAILGSYRIEKLIGQGGMGSVFLASHTDDSLERKVVVKMVRADMESEEIRSRLRSERSILAGLEHANIARLYDSGTDASGRPYFVQEYIDGESLDAYTEGHRSSLEERLALFAKVCDAVQYAHQNLVVHRDLKPKNIFVTMEGEPKLLDFGIAKLLDPEPSADGPEITATSYRMLTPSYASPEQIRGGRITTGSDVYSLGVILYELLTGELPRRIPSRLLADDEKALFAKDSPSPSSVTGDSRLRGDLDAIVARALRVAPKERYESAGQLAQELDHRRRGLPVLAREGTWRYRAGKFLRRHRRAVIVVGLAFSMLVAFAISVAFLAAEVAAERDQARLERNEKDEVLRLVLDVFRLASPYATRGEALTVRAALERSVPILQERVGDQPDVQARLMLVSGSILANLGLHQKALELLEGALDFYQQYESRPENFPGQEALVETLTTLARARKGVGELDQAEALVTKAVELARQRARIDPGERADLFLAGSLTEWVSILCHRQEYSAALSMAEESLSLTAGLKGGEARRISTLEYLARIRSSEGLYAEAADLNRQALELRRRRDGIRHPSQVATLNNLASNLRRSDDLDAAQVAYGEALEIERTSFGERAGPHLPTLLSNLAAVHFHRGDFEAAMGLYLEAREVVVQSSGEEHWFIYALDLRLAQSRLGLGMASRAERDLRQLLATWAPRLGDHWRLDVGRGALGESLSLQERCEDAEILLVASFESLMEKAAHKTRREALDRLRGHFLRCGEAEDLGPFEARFTAGPVSSSD